MKEANKTFKNNYKDSELTITNFPFKIWKLLNKRRKKHLIAALFLMFLSSISELISLSSALPFLYVLTEPEKVYNNPNLQEFFTLVNLNSSSDLLIPVTFVFIGAAITSGLIRLFGLWFNSRLVGAIGSDLSNQVYMKVLNQSYDFHINEKSSKIKIALVQHLNIVMKSFNDYLLLVWSIVTITFLVGGMLLTNWLIIISSLLIFGFTYIFLSKKCQRRLSDNGFKVAEANKKQLKLLDEGMGSIRDIILDGIQNVYLKIYSDVDRSMRKLISQNYFLISFPRYLLESISLIFIALISLTFTILLKDSSSAIPVLGTIALCLQKLVPTLQRLYSAWAGIKSGWGSILNVYDFIILEANDKKHNAKKLIKSPIKTIKFENIYFKYQNRKEPTIKGINLQIKSGTSIGIIGKTGEGKSTFLDLFMGLLEPSSGMISFDNNNIYEGNNISLWRKEIAHVPQEIYLSDASFSENIAIGKLASEIDFEKVQYAAKIAKIDDYIQTTELGYETKVGELGVSLSGGQKQRIGIARALYKSSSILIFDEATSSLDIETEKQVVNSIRENFSNLTIIIVAHNLNTLRNCDRILSINNGKIDKDGPPNKLLNSASFK